MLPRLTPNQYAALNRQAAIYLDSIGWSGGNTTLEAVAAERPIVTLPGRFMRGRHSAAILTMMGVSETIACDREDYVAIAARLGLDPKWRREVAAKVAARKDRVLNDPVALHGLEDFIERTVDEASRTSGHGEN